MPDDIKTTDDPAALTAADRNGEWEHLVLWCLELYDKFSGSEYRKNKEQEISDSVSAYEQEEKHTNEPWDGASNIPLPLTTISIDNLEPRLVAGLVGKRPFVRFDTDADPEPVEITELEQWFNDELDQVVKIETFAGCLIHKLLQDGTVFPEACYDYRDTTRRDFMFVNELPEEVAQSAQNYKAQIEGANAAGQPPPEVPEELKPMMGAKVVGGVYVDADGKPLTVERTEKVFEGGQAKLIDWSDIFIPDTFEDWDKTPVIRRVRKTYGELQRDSKAQAGWRNIGPWLLGQTSEDSPLSGAQAERDDVAVTGKETLECIVCYVPYVKRTVDQRDQDITDWSEDNYVATIAVDSKTLIRIQKRRDVCYSDRHVIRRVPLLPELNKSYGTSIWGKMKSIQKMANEIFNMALNTATIILIPWFFYGRTTGWTGEKKKLRPGVGVPVDNTQDILFPTFPINPSQFFEYLQFIITFWERLFNVGDLQIGRQSENTKTATEALSVIQEGNISHNYRSVSLKDYFCDFITVIYDLYYQYLPLEHVWTAGTKPIKIERAKMRRARNFRLMSSTEMANKFIERQTKEDLWNKVKEGHALGVGNLMEGWLEMLKAFGVEEPQRFTDPMVAMVIKTLQQLPEAGAIFQQSVAQAAAKAQQLTQGALGAGPGGPGGPGGPKGVSVKRPVQGVPPSPGGFSGGRFARPSDVPGTTGAGS